jgi:cell division protein FtsX
MSTIDQQLARAFLGPAAVARREAGMRRQDWLNRLAFIRRVIVEFAFIAAILMCLVALACFLVASAVRL